MNTKIINKYIEILEANNAKSLDDKGEYVVAENLNEIIEALDGKPIVIDRKFPNTSGSNVDLALVYINLLVARKVDLLLVTNT